MKIWLICGALAEVGWDLARFRRVGSQAGWSRFLYRAGAEADPEIISKRLAAAVFPKEAQSSGQVLELSHLDGSPFGSPSTSGDPQLDRYLAICEERGHALILSAAVIAALAGSTAKQAENWLGAHRPEVPPAGYASVRFQRAGKRGGRATEALVLATAQPIPSIAKALGVAETEIVLVDPPAPLPATPPTRGPAWADLTATWADAPALIWDVTPVTIAVAPKGARQPDEPPPLFIQLPFADTSAERAAS